MNRSQKLYKQAVNRLEIPAGLNERTTAFLQKNQSINKINQINDRKTKPKMPRGKRTLIIAAVSILMTILMGAALNLYVVRIFDENGNSYLEYRPFRRRMPPEGELLERLEWEGEFYDTNKKENENIFGVILYGEGNNGRRDPGKTINDYDEFMEFMTHTDKNVCKLPEYIPDGYEFHVAYIHFYIDENFDFKNAELIERVEKFGNIYEKYYISANPETIQIMHISYTKKGENGEEMYLWYVIHLNEPLALNTHRTGAETSQLEILQMPQFYRSAIMSTEYTENGKNWTMYSFYAINTVPARRYYIDLDMSKYSTREFGIVEYRIESHFAARDEIIKIAGSIK